MIVEIYLCDIDNIIEERDRHHWYWFVTSKCQAVRGEERTENIMVK